MQKAYQSIYVSFYRWNFKNFGQGSIPQFKSLFNVSFLLVVLLTNAMLVTKLMIKAHLITLDMKACVAIVTGAVVFLLINHLIFLNNRWFKNINARLANINRRNLNVCSVALLLNVFIACGLSFI
jgi:nitrate reductase gamma subunit